MSFSMQDKMEQQFESLINSVEAIIWEADFKTSVVNYVSQFVFELLGYSVERWLEEPGLFMQIVHSEDLPSVERAKNSVTPENNRYEVVYRVLKANGEQVWLCDRVNVVFRDGQPWLLRGLSTDVSERHRIEEALALVVEATLAASELQGVTDIAQATLSRICQVLGLSFGQVWFMDASSGSLVCSPHVSFSTGEFSSLRQASLAQAFSVENPKGLPGHAASAGSAVFIDDLSQEERLIASAPFRTDSPFRSGFAFPVKNGDEILCVFEFFAPSVLRPEKYFLNAIEEISAHLSVVFERRIAQELLTIQREHEEIILDAMPVMVWFKDTKGKILRVNRAGAAIRGLEPWQMIGKTDWELYPDEADLYYADDLQVIESGRAKLGIVEQHLQGDGSKTWVSTDKIPYRDHDGTVHGVIVFASDISKLKNAEEELLAIRKDLEVKVEERTKELNEANIYFALSRDLLCIAGKDGYFRRLSAAWQEKLGYTMQELLSHSFMSFVHPEDRAATAEQMSVLSDGGHVSNFENRYLCKDGSICWLMWSASNPPGSELIYAVAYDVTDRKAAESELLDMSMALKNAVEGIAKVNQDNRLLSVNESYAALHGLPSFVLSGRRITDFINAEDLDKWTACYDAMLLDGKAEIELVGKREDGSTFHEQVTLVKMESKTSHFQGYYVFNKDISARVATELSLRQSEARFHHLATHVPGGIYQYLRRPDGTFEFPYVSPGCGAILGLSAEVLMQNPQLLFDMLYPEDLDIVNAAQVEAMTHMSTFNFEGRIKAPAGEKWIHAESTPEYLKNGDVIFNGLVTDITEKRFADEKIRKLNEDLSERVDKLAAVNRELESLTRKLELAYDAAMEASKVKSEFVANISHEIRTPISAVIGMSELLLDTSLTDEQKQFSSMVRDSAQSLLTIINDILDFSKMEAGHLELEVTEVNLLNVVEDCAELLAPSARKKGLSFFTFVSPELPENVLGDTVRIRQILLNLASNAVKFTTFGEVVISVTNSPVSPELVRFTVSDTGIGLSESAKFRLFNPFFQADGSTTRNYGGTGLGLSICKLLVDLMGGNIDFISQENKGATFWFDLPLPICAGSRSLKEAAQANLNALSQSAQSQAQAQGEIQTPSGLPRYQPGLKETVLLAGSSKKLLEYLPDYLCSSTLPVNVECLDLSATQHEDHENLNASPLAVRVLVLDVGGAMPLPGQEDIFLGRAGFPPPTSHEAYAGRQRSLPLLVGDALNNLEKSCRRGLQFLSGARIIVLLPSEVGKMSGEVEASLRRTINRLMPLSSISFSPSVKTMFILKPLRFMDLLEALNRLITGQPIINSTGSIGSAGNIIGSLNSSAGDSSLGTIGGAAQSTAGQISAYEFNDSNFAAEGKSSSGIVLVAEDNPVMQELAIRQIDRLGFAAEVVKNGRLAVEAVRSGKYVLVLMDCQMPEMDGYEATMTIRREEKEDLLGGRHVPIIAMTASAMKGDRENCIASGMDDYLSKPVGQKELLRVLNKYVCKVEDAPALTNQAEQNLIELNSNEQFSQEHFSQEQHFKGQLTPARQHIGQPTGQALPLDLDELKALYGEEDLPRLIQSFLKEGEELIEQIQEAFDNNDGAELSRLSHQLKGLAVVMTAFDFSQTALYIERHPGKSQEDISQHLDILRKDFSLLSEYIFANRADL